MVMNMGVQRADAQPGDGTADDQEHWNVDSETRDFIGPETWPEHLPEPEPEESRLRARMVGALLMLLALAWTAASFWSIARMAPALTLPNALQWIAFVSPPLILLGIAWLILGQTPRRETERFTRAVATMRSESSALEGVLAMVATRLEENHSKLRNEAGKLMSLGDEASDRLGRVAYYLSKESTNLDKKSEALESAAENARVDIGVLLQDLPRAEEQARAVAEAMKDAGLAAHTQAGALESQLSALIARGREADEVAGGAAQRLGAHLARVESTAATATARLEEAGASMTAAVDGTLARASEGIDAVRSGVEAQGAAMLALIDQSRATLERAGDDAARNLTHRLEQIGGKIESLAGHLAAQDAASHALLNGLTTEFGELEARLTQLRDSGASGAGVLTASFGAVLTVSQDLVRELSSGQDRARQLIDRTHEMAQALTGVAAQLNGDLPAALVRVEEHAERAQGAVTAVAPAVASMEESARSATAKLNEAESSIARQHELLEASGTALANYLLTRLGEVEAKLAGLREIGGTSTLQLGEAITDLRVSVSDLTSSLEGGGERAADLSERARELDHALAAITTQLDQRVPAALLQVEDQAERAQTAVSAVAPTVAAMEESARSATAKLVEAEKSISRQNELLEASGSALATHLMARLGEVEEKLAGLREIGGTSTLQLGEAITGVRGLVADLAGSLDGGGDRAAELSARVRELNQGVAALTADLDDRVPTALLRVEEQAGRAQNAVAAVAPAVAALEESARSATERLVQAESSMARQRELLQASGEDLATNLLAQLSEVEEKLATLRQIGGSSTAELGEAITSLRTSVSDLAGSLEGGGDRAADLSSRARELEHALAAITAELNDRVPAALSRVEVQAGRAQEAVSAVAPTVAAIEESARSATARLVEAEGSMVRQQELLETSGNALTAQLLARIGEVEDKLAGLREMSGTSTAELDETIVGLRASLSDLTGSLASGGDRVEDLSARVTEVSQALAAITTELDERVPAALGRVEEQAGRTHAAASTIVPRVEAIRASADDAAAKLGQVEASIARQEQALEEMLRKLSEGVSAAEAQLRLLGEAASQADTASSRIASETGPELIEALLRVRETANQAAERAREAIAAVIPQSAAALAEASGEALRGAVTNSVEQKLAELSLLAERATEAARAASERLTRQMLKIGETASAVESRIEDARKERDSQDAESFSRRVALLIESLNSTAIDVTKILSNEVTDSAWAAYLKGDRGVFTRRAVRLIDNAEARAIMQHYENEPEFREQVNRYIHDFEAMLRRILADRDSSALGVTILSSDMGKLYVALAQAIERLR